MSLRSLAFAVLMAAFAVAAAAQDASTGTPETQTMETTAGRSTDATAEPAAGVPEWKERINITARKTHRHDRQWLDSRDRSSWREFTVWQGVRDERPLIARKTLGFHAPEPRRTRFERVLLIGRGPLTGPAPAK